jgi:hypothetical protein
MSCGFGLGFKSVMATIFKNRRAIGVARVSDNSDAFVMGRNGSASTPILQRGSRPNASSSVDAARFVRVARAV